MELKRCTGCKQEKPLSNYYRDIRYSSHVKYRPRCKSCINKSNRDRYQLDPSRIRDATYKRRYGISKAEYDTMLEEQNHTCALCEKPEVSDTFKFLSVDHDHSTNKVRALLCGPCNRLLGQYEKNRELFQKFQSYIDKYK